MSFNVREIYKDYDERVVAYMEFVVGQIEQDYSIVPSSWRVSLDLIADNLMLYFDALDDIKKNGVIHYDLKGIPHTNPACRLQNVCNQNVIKLLNNFALTPMSKSKMKKFDEEDVNSLVERLLE